jgi:hypothetical protein
MRDKGRQCRFISPHRSGRRQASDAPAGAGCSFLILEEAVNPESAKDSVRYPPLRAP